MIEFIEKKGSHRIGEYRVAVDGVVLDKSHVFVPREKSLFELVSIESDTSKKIAQYALNEFPLSVGHVNLRYYPDGIQHLDQNEGIFISRNYKGEKHIQYLLHVTLGGSSLVEWRFPYSFADYVYELYRLLRGRGDIDQLNLIDSSHKILDNAVFLSRGTELPDNMLEAEQMYIKSSHGLEIVVPYTSPETTIAVEVKRISSLIGEAHNEVVNILLPQTLEIRKVENSVTTQYQLFLNNKPYPGTRVNGHGEHLSGGPRYFITLEDPKSLFSLESTRFADIPDKVVGINIELEDEPSLKWEHIQVASTARIKTPLGHEYLAWEWEDQKPFIEDYTIDFTCDLDVDNWKGQHTPTDYFDEIGKVFPDSQKTHFYFEEPGSHQFHILFKVDYPTLRIVNEVMRCRDFVFGKLTDIENHFAATSSNSIVKPFDFPEEVAVACEQYLLYFTQFLRDLGVNATSDIKHEAGQVLFTVTPSNEKEALDKVRTALDVYLHLPASPVSNDMSNEIALQRLESQVLRFQSDLRLAAAELQAKNATIEAQQLTINVQKALLNGEILLDSVKNVTPKETDDERVEFLRRTIILTKYNEKGVELHWARMWRQLKDLFLEKDDKE
jgi:hypothetical protein